MFNKIKECFRIMIIMIMCVSFSVNSMNACASEDDSSLLEYYINEKEKFQNISEQLYLGNISEEEFENQVNLLELNTTKMILAEKIYNKDVDAYSYYDDFAKDKFGVNAYEIALFKKYPAKAAKAITYAS